MDILPRVWPEQKTGWKFPKMHLLTHYTECIRRGGLTVHYNANLYEHLHIDILKKPWRRSNKRNVDGHIVTQWCRHSILETLDGVAPPRASYNTAMDKVFVIYYVMFRQCKNFFWDTYVSFLFIRQWRSHGCFYAHRTRRWICHFEVDQRRQAWWIHSLLNMQMSGPETTIS
jgi:hypothetical protein